MTDEDYMGQEHRLIMGLGSPPVHIRIPLSLAWYVYGFRNTSASSYVHPECICSFTTPRVNPHPMPASPQQQGTVPNLLDVACIWQLQRVCPPVYMCDYVAVGQGLPGVQYSQLVVSQACSHASKLLKAHQPAVTGCLTRCHGSGRRQG